MYPALVTFLADILCLLFLFRMFSSFSSTIHSFFSIFGLLAISYLLLACLIREAILHLSFPLHYRTTRGGDPASVKRLVTECTPQLPDLLFEQMCGRVTKTESEWPEAKDSQLIMRAQLLFPLPITLTSRVLSAGIDWLDSVPVTLRQGGEEGGRNHCEWSTHPVSLGRYKHHVRDIKIKINI